MKRQREETAVEEESGEGDVVNPPDKYLGVQLMDLGKKNWDKLLNPKTGRIVEPPKKKCQKCYQLMDWRKDGCIKSVGGKYYYGNICAGECYRLVNQPASIDDCIDKMAGWARRKGLENGFKVNCTPEESREIFHATWRNTMETAPVAKSSFSRLEMERILSRSSETSQASVTMTHYKTSISFVFHATGK
ncbi:hypothetical protein BJ741DRAFT_577541 [Chytriomyces cf. hyalinus JEL632]|nr:hypothetical protein BJ741DRAFT_577541 [Chytriomyces cf. hyalinus JEL632]